MTITTLSRVPGTGLGALPHLRKHKSRLRLSPEPYAERHGLPPANLYKIGGGSREYDWYDIVDLTRWVNSP